MCKIILNVFYYKNKIDGVPFIFFLYIMINFIVYLLFLLNKKIYLLS
jgi:hypothetical protein